MTLKGGSLILFPTHNQKHEAYEAAPHATPPLMACVDEPSTVDVAVRASCRFSGWALSAGSEEVQIRVTYGGKRQVFSTGRARADVIGVWGRNYPAAGNGCGFLFHLDLRGLEPAVDVMLEFDDGHFVATSPAFRVSVGGAAALPRADYKQVWNSVSGSVDAAKLAVAGYTSEEDLGRAAENTLGILRDTVGIQPTDTVLEIGAGVGRVGALLAPLCKRWIAADVSENMVAHTLRRLSMHGNVEGVVVSGWDLAPIESGSVDLVYCTVVFMHLDEWERFSYVREALRVLRPGGRLYVDNVNLLSDDGWAFFMSHLEDFHPLERPPNISKTSTPEELHAYFARAGFTEIQQRTSGLWVATFGRKAGATP